MNLKIKEAQGASLILSSYGTAKLVNF